MNKKTKLDKIYKEHKEKVWKTKVIYLMLKPVTFDCGVGDVFNNEDASKFSFSGSSNGKKQRNLATIILIYIIVFYIYT